MNELNSVWPPADGEDLQNIFLDICLTEHHPDLQPHHSGVHSRRLVYSLDASSPGGSPGEAWLWKVESPDYCYCERDSDSALPHCH